jgi:hypothetical protein
MAFLEIAWALLKFVIELMIVSVIIIYFSQESMLYLPDSKNLRRAK